MSAPRSGGQGGSPSGDNIALGIGVTLISVVVFGVQDASVKWLVQDFSIYQVVMMRYWAFAGFSLFLVIRQTGLRTALASRAPGLQVLRGLLLLADFLLFALALETVPLAEAQAVILIFPLLVTLFAIPILGEKVGVFRLTAVACGFGGTLLILRPGGLPYDGGVLLALAAAVFYALYITFTRRVTGIDSHATNMVYVGLVGMVLSTVIGVFHWQPMDGMGLAVMVMVMATTCLAHWLMIKALSLAPASTLQPFNYLSLPFAILAGWVVFGQLIDGVALLGALVICGAGLAVMSRERWLARVGRSKSADKGTDESLRRKGLNP